MTKPTTITKIFVVSSVILCWNRKSEEIWNLMMTVTTTTTTMTKVINLCRNIKRKENDTWINEIIVDTFTELHQKKLCHSVECYDRNRLIAGLYGVHIGGCFFGESMFSEVSNTSKFCLLYLIAILKKNLFSILDSQFYNEHLIQFGAFEIKNKIYLKKLMVGININRNFTFIENFQEVLSLLQPNSHKS